MSITIIQIWLLINFDLCLLISLLAINRDTIFCFK